MRYSALCVLLLAISEPLLLVHAKVVLIVPRQVRRSPSVPWRPPSVHYKKSAYGGNDYHRQAYRSYGSRPYYRKPYRPYPQGGDDFDQGHETATHIHIPYGKDISHGISFGKGYIPYDNLKNGNLPFAHKYPVNPYTRQPVPEYAAGNGFTASVGQDYATSASAHGFDGPAAHHVDSFFSDMETAARNELHDTIKDTTGRYYTSRSLEKDLNQRNRQALNSAIEKDRGGGGGGELAKDTSSSTAYIPNTVSAAAAAFAHNLASSADAAYAQNQAASGIASGAVVLPAGIPSATIAGNKDGIVLRDSVSLDEYQRKLEELTKAWPSVLTNDGYGGAGIHQLQATVDRYQAAAAAAGTNDGWIATALAQPKQGYAVTEERAETQSAPDQRYFRTVAPVQVTAYQHQHPATVVAMQG